MPERVKLTWDLDTYDYEFSDREYNTYTIQAVEEVTLGYGNNRELVNLRVYRDPETGFLVTDVVAYENFMKKVGRA